MAKHIEQPPLEEPISESILAVLDQNLPKTVANDQKRPEIGPEIDSYEGLGRGQSGVRPNLGWGGTNRVFGKPCFLSPAEKRPF